MTFSDVIGNDCFELGIQRNLSSNKVKIAFKSSNKNAQTEFMSPAVK